MKKSLIFLLVLLSYNSFSQQVFNDFWRFYPKDTASDLPGVYDSCFVSVQGDYRFNATGVTNEFFLDYFSNDFITNELKDQVSERLDGKNRFGYQFQASVTGGAKIDSVTTLLAGISSRQLISSVHSKDLFNLVFRGNKMFAGETADLAPFKYTSVDYQSLFLGMSKEVKPEKLTIWGGISAIRGGNFRMAEAERGNFYTDPDGAYIEFDTDFNASLSPGSPGLISESNGIGASAFLGADVKLGKSTIGFNVSDLGFIRWKNLKTYSADGVYRFEGEEVPNVLSFNDTLFTSYNADSLANEVGVEIKEENKYYFLPTFLNLNYVYRHSDKLFFVAGVKYMVNAGYSPKIWVRPAWEIFNNLLIHSTLSYGGFGRTDFELGLAGRFANGFTGYLNIFAAEFLVAPGKTSGNGLSVALIRSF